jgi:hypothetical protein
MSTTALSMITRAMRLAGVIGKGETLDDDEAQDGLEALQGMIDSWNIERLYVYYIVQEALTLVANQQTYTMGSGGDLSTTRPTQIDDSCFTRFNGTDFPLRLIDKQAFDAIPVKTVTSNVPMWLFADMQYPLVSLNLYPVPNAAGTAYIQSWRQLQAFTALTDVLALPPGYKRAIEYSLAEEYGPEFGVEIPKKVQQIATKARANLKRLNSPKNVMRSEIGYMNRSRFADNIYQG